VNPTTITIAIAFPKHEDDRAKLRAKLPGVPLPAIYEGGEDRPCPRCGVVLNVGPRVVASGVTAYCVPCAYVLTRGMRHETVSLDNPDSEPERLA